MQKVPSTRELVWSFFGHGSNAFVVLTLIVLGGSFLQEGSLWQAARFFPTGVFLFLSIEYFTHRYQLHAPPWDLQGLRRVERTQHTDHHRDPHRIDRLFVPVRDTIPIAGVLTLIYFLLTRDWLIARALLFGNLAGFLYYEHTHFIAHVNVTPTTRWGRYMKKVHLWHHYKNENYWFGVTSPLFDLLLGTYRDPSEVEKSPTARSLHDEGASSKVSPLAKSARPLSPPLNSVDN